MKTPWLKLSSVLIYDWPSPKEMEKTGEVDPGETLPTPPIPKYPTIC